MFYLNRKPHLNKIPERNKHCKCIILNYYFKMYIRFINNLDKNFRC